MKGFCPICQELQDIFPTGETIPNKRGTGNELRSATYKKVADHPAKSVTLPNGMVVEEQCEGSGKKI